MTDSRRTRGWGDETGIALMEIVVSAAVLGIVALALLAGIDAAASSSGREKVRAVAMSLAQQDQERMRAMRVVDLPRAAATTRDVAVGNTTYTVTSEAHVVNDATGTTESCLDESTLASYLRITSRTQVKGATPSLPVTLSSLIAPPVDGGWLVVRLNGADDRPIVGMPVDISGPTNRTEATNATGCAVFGPITTGDYQITLDTPDWTNPELEVPVVESATVNTGKVAVRKLLYDLRGTVNVGFDTRPTYREWNEDLNGDQDAVIDEIDDASASEVYGDRPVQPDEAHTMAAAHPGIPTTQMRVYAPTAFTSPTLLTKSAALYTAKLFPFTSPYGFHGGGCADQHPTRFDTDYFDTFPGRVQVNPDSVQSLTVREPALNLTVLDRSGLRAPNSSSRYINVVLTHISDDRSCKQRIVVAGNYNSSASPIYKQGEYIAVPTGSDADKKRIELGGTLKLPGLPFGRWNVCVDDATPAGVTPKVTGESRSVDVDLTTREGSAPFKIDLNRAGNRVQAPCDRTPL